jgi:protein-glucosylgalactosylhydroxylysine glucosidase
MKTHRIIEPAKYPAYIANGLIGLRVPFVPLGAGTALVNGYWGLMERRETECYEPAPYPLGLGLCINDKWFSSGDDNAVEPISQEYDFSCGELTSRFRLHADGVTAHVEVLTFASRSWPTAVCQRVTATPDSTCTLILQSVVEHLGLPGRVIHSEVPRVDCCDFQLLHEARGGLSTLGVAQHNRFEGEGLLETFRSDWAYDRPMPSREYRVNATDGRPVVMTTVATMVPSVMHTEPHHQAGRMCNLALGRCTRSIRALRTWT